MSSPKTISPISANISAVACPIPEAAPVTTTTRACGLGLGEDEWWTATSELEHVLSAALRGTLGGWTIVEQRRPAGGERHRAGGARARWPLPHWLSARQHERRQSRGRRPPATASGLCPEPGLGARRRGRRHDDGGSRCRTVVRPWCCRADASAARSRRPSIRREACCSGQRGAGDAWSGRAPRSQCRAGGWLAWRSGTVPRRSRSDRWVLGRGQVRRRKVPRRSSRSPAPRRSAVSSDRLEPVRVARSRPDHGHRSGADLGQPFPRRGPAHRGVRRALVAARGGGGWAGGQPCARRTTRSCRSEEARVSLAKSTAIDRDHRAIAT